MSACPALCSAAQRAQKHSPREIREQSESRDQSRDQLLDRAIVRFPSVVLDTVIHQSVFPAWEEPCGTETG